MDIHHQPSLLLHHKQIAQLPIHNHQQNYYNLVLRPYYSRNILLLVNCSHSYLAKHCPC